MGRYEVDTTRRLEQEHAVDWSQVRVLDLHIHEKQQTEAVRSLGKKFTTAELGRLKSAFSTLLENPECAGEQRHAINDLIAHVESVERLREASPSERVAAVRLPEGVLRSIDLDPQPSRALEEYKLISDGVILMGEMKRLNAIRYALLAEEPRPDIIGLSDSHTTTGLTLAAAQQAGFPIRDAAVLSFDHHQDIGSTNIIARKHNVMRYALESTDLAAVTVLGDGIPRKDRATLIDRKPVWCYEGKGLHTDGRPNVEAFMRALDDTFEMWKNLGIKHVYPSVDLDALRITKMGYTATDYNAMVELERITGQSSIEDKLKQFLQDPENPDTQRSMRYGIDQLIRSELLPYYGLPASWVGRALDKAKEYGLTIGIPHPENGKRLVGDVTEFSGTDVKGRTGKITQALMTRMLRSAS